MPDPSNSANRASRAADVRAQQAAAEKRRRLLGVLGVVVALVLVVGGAFAFQRLAIDDPKVSTTEHFVAIGPKDAAHTVVIYEDFLCPFCGELERHTSKDLAALAAEGKVRVEYRPFQLLGIDYSKQSAAVFGVVLTTSGAEVAKEFHDLLFESQPEESGPYPGDEELIALAVKAGADEAEVSEALDRGVGTEWVEAASNAADNAGVNSTPTVLIDGEPFRDGNSVEELGDNLIKKIG
ncbi:DsbA family protein [Nocardioides cavernaquae]|uniref:Disulfide bond formation protein DsbA n=1 Tax=Nocardioides cavernaquae TaxID=2321396 RepID=A0A3A5H6U3_9ACTN|nr:thioredoxin domain-containing protein [Nocardioides cavernaquae]RJS45125.1 disulfide bond formation protein DsbA [Nocardioides cavernaquae]